MSALISMKMSASWDAEKSGSNAVPRLCSLSLAQIILDRPLEPDSPNANFFVAVRMRGSGRRVLRSPEITVAPPKAASPVNGLATPGFVYSMSDSSALPSSGASAGAAGSVLIDFNCSIQYSHLLNRDANVLQILLQRRKKYKNKTMNFGYKTLAYCNVNLAQVLQRRIENRYLELYTDPNCITQSIGRVEVQSLSTVPIEKDLLNGKRKALDEDEEYPLPDTYSEDSDHGEESDDDPIAENDESGHNRQKKLVKAMSMGQKQIKQKLIGLLKKLKMGDPNEEDLDVGENSKLWDEFDLIGTVSDIEEEDSDVDGVDTVSIRSTPKPTLRPFFATAGGGGSDETLSADVGTKLLKRLQRQLFAQSEADTPPDTCLNTVLSPAAGVAQRPIETAHTKKTLPIGGSTQTASFPLATDVRDGRSSLRHHRGSNLSGGRLAKRFAHMGRRSNVSRAEKQATVSATDAFKLSECPTEQKSLTITGAFAVQDPGPSDRQGSPSGNLSHQESSDDSVPARGHHRLKYHGNTEITSSALGDEVLAASVAASSTRRQFPGEPSTPDAHYTGATSTVPSDLLTTDALSAVGHPAEKFSTCSIDYLGNVLFLVNPLEPGGKLAAEAFSGRDLQLHLVTSYGEMKQLFARLVTKSQSQTRRASDCDVIKLCVLGGDMLVSFALRAYVDQLSSRSPELAAAFRFYIVPITGLINAKPPSLSHIPSVDQTNISQHETRTAMKQNHGSTPTAMRHEFPTSDQSTDSDHHNAVTTFKTTSSPVCTHNAVASHLCKIDPAYATLFSDLCASWSPGAVDSSPTATTTTSENLTTWNSPSSAIGLFERTVVYLHKSRSVLPMPIGSCLLGIASSFSSGAKSQKSAEQPASQLTYPAVSGHLDSIVAPSTADGVTKFSSAALNEEMLMPFLISVSLGSDPLPPRTSQMSRPGTGGDPQTFSSPHPINASDLGSVVSDPEGSFAATGTTSAATTTTKRSQSPEATTTVASSQAHSTTSSSVNMSLGSRFWDLQLEYWVVPAASSSVGSAGSSPATGPPPQTTSPSAHPVLLSSSSVSTPTQLLADIVHPRRVTMKSICRGLVITLGSTSTQYYTTIRGCEPHVPGADLLNTSFRSGGALPTSSGGPTPPQQLLSLAVWSKEKKQKIMRIGRRGKDCCCKFELIDGIQRLLCTGRGVIGPGAASSISVERGREPDGAPPPTPTQGLTDVGSLALESLLKSSASLSLSASSSYQPGSSTNSMLRVSVDGVEWVGLRFFQITSTWRTHIKSFPLCSLSVGRADPSHANDSFPISVDPTTFSSH